MLKQDAKIKKSDIKEACLTVPRTKLVTGPLTIGGVTHEANTLEFVGFRGVKVSPGVWGGAFHFKEVGATPPTEQITPAELAAYRAKDSPASPEPVDRARPTPKGNGQTKKRGER